MMVRVYLTAALLAANIVAVATNSRAQATGAIAGRILAVKCAGLLKQNASGPSVALHDPQDVGRTLTAGNQLQCAGDGYMEVFVPEGTKKITAAQSWFVIQPVPAKPPFPEIAYALNQYGIRGATRGLASSSRILWPSNGSSVIPEHFIIRWTPAPQKIVVSIMSEAKDVTLWGPTEMDGEAGSLKSDAISSALADYKKKSGSTVLILTLSLAKASDWDEAHFSILGGQQEQELNSQLDFWRKHTDGLALHLGRGYTFSQHNLFVESAEEYDSALNFAPESRYLLEEAIKANRSAGQDSRVKELETREGLKP
jgi:hypothetical protein